MKNILKRISVYIVVCVIISMCSSINNISAYELIATVNGKVEKIDVKDVTYEWRKNIRGKHLKIIGKASKDEFWGLEYISSECETIDMSDLEIDVIPHQSFIQNEKLKKVILPKKLKEIEFCCFSDCYKLDTVVLPDSLKKIDDGSFQSCPNLNMQISSKVKLGRNVFWDSPGVTIVEIEPEPLCGCFSWVWHWMCERKEKTV